MLYLLIGLGVLVTGFAFFLVVHERGCPSSLGPTKCGLKRGHSHNHRGVHWSGKTLFWRELDTNQLQELINTIREFGRLQPIGNLRNMSKTWQLVEERTARLQLAIDGSRTVGR